MWTKLTTWLTPDPQGLAGPREDASFHIQQESPTPPREVHRTRVEREWRGCYEGHTSPGSEIGEGRLATRSTAPRAGEVWRSRARRAVERADHDRKLPRTSTSSTRPEPSA